MLFRHALIALSVLLSAACLAEPPTERKALEACVAVDDGGIECRDGGPGGGSGDGRGRDAGCGDAGDGGCGYGGDGGVDAGGDGGIDARDAGDGGTDAGDGGMDGGTDGGTDGGSDGGMDAGMDGGPDGGMDAGVDAPSDAGVDAPVDAGVCTMAAPPLDQGPDLRLKVDLKSGGQDDVAGAFVSYEVGFELKAGDRGGSAECEGTYSASASGHFKITVAGQIIGAAIRGGGASSICKTPECQTPPQRVCVGPQCEQLDGNIGASIVRGVEFDLCKKWPWICKFGSVKAVGTISAGVVGNGNKQAGVPAGSCTQCCANGASKWSAGVGPQVGAKGKLSLRIQLWRFFVEFAGTLTGCATATANLGVDCNGNLAPGVRGYGHFSACLESAMGLGTDTTIKFIGPEIEICIPLGWWQVCTRIPKCFIDVGNKDLACPGGL